MPPKQKVESLTIESLKNIWESELLLSIKKEFKIEFDNIKSEIKALNIKCAEIERSQNYLSKDYDNFKESLQTVKKHVSETSQKIKNLEERLQTTEDNTYITNKCWSITFNNIDDAIVLKSLVCRFSRQIIQSKLLLRSVN